MDDLDPDIPIARHTIATDSKIYSDLHETLKHKPGLKRKQDPWSYKYNIETTRMNTDPFVRKTFRSWNSDIYESVRGHTKRADISAGLQNFAKFSRHDYKLNSMPNKYREAYQKALKLAQHTFKSHEPLHRTSVPDVCDTMNLDSSAGFSFPGKKKSECVEQAYDTASYIAHFISSKKHVYIPPSKLALRGHLSETENLKTRAVWVYPFEISILEGKWALPYYSHLEQNVPEVHFGEGSMQNLAKHLMSGIANHDNAVEVTLDWSGFDTSVPNFLIDDAFDIIFSSFDEEYTNHHGVDIYGGHHMASKNLEIQKFIRNYFKYTKIMLPDGSIYAKSHGIPSGSFFTQAVGTIVNYIATLTLNIYFGWNGKRFRFLGDDSSFLVPNGRSKLDPEQIKKAAWEAFGLSLKTEKLRITHHQQQRKFLGYQCEGYRFIRPTDEWFKLVLYPERDVEYLEQSASRVLAYYLLGGCNDELYCQFFRNYLGRYPIINGRRLPLTRGLKRLFKYVLRLDFDYLEFPDFEKLDLLKVPFALSLGDEPFSFSY